VEKTAKIPWVVADFGLQQVLLPKLHYPLLVTALDKKQCHNILKLVLSQGLPAMGVHQHFPCAVAHRPLA